MAMMVSLRNFHLDDRIGISANVKANVPIYIPKPLQRAAIAAGMVFCDNADEHLKAAFDEGETPPQRTREEIEALVMAAFPAIVEKNNSSDFTANGVPTSGAVFRACGEKVPQKDLNTMWIEYKSKQNEAE